MVIKVKDLLDFDIKPFLYGVLFSRITSDEQSEIPEKFYVYTAFRASKAVNYTDFNFLEYSSKLVDRYNYVSGYKNWAVKSVTDTYMKVTFPILNDLGITIEAFNDIVYKRLMQESWLYEEGMSEEKKMFMRGYMETRGSIDLGGNYISQDYFYNNRIELKRIQIFMDLLGIPFSYLNFNPRELQGDFITGKRKRNTQFRINIHYYVSEFGLINEYKALIYEKNYGTIGNMIEKDNVIYFEVEPPKRNDSISFIKYINFFSNNIYKQDLNKQKIMTLRKNLGFNKDANKIEGKSRNQTIIEVFDSVSPDQCAVCGTKETFIRKSTQRQAFEVHHVIPFHNGKQFDNIANLVKLCPTCHGSLKKGRSTKEEQVKNIISILHGNSAVYEYTSSILGYSDINVLAEKIQDMLG